MTFSNPPAVFNLFEHRDGIIRRRRLQLCGHDRPCTGVPTQHRLVIVGRADILGGFIASHRLPQEVIGGTAAAGGSTMQLSPSLTFVNDPLVIRSMVGIGEARQKGGGACYCLRIAKLVGERKQQQYERLLVLWIAPQDIEADTFSLCRLIQQAVALRPFKRCGNRRSAKSLELELGLI